jgi:hypothetical protein
VPVPQCGPGARRPSSTGITVLEKLVEVQPLVVAKIDDAIEDHLNDRDPRHPPPEFPATSQIEG